MDEDMFVQDNEEVIRDENNPIKEKLTKDLHQIEEKIVKTKNTITDLCRYVNEALEQISKMAVNDNVTPDSDKELVNIHCEPVIWKKRTSVVNTRPLDVITVWQRVTDKKWVIGVFLQNRSNWTLKDCKFFVNIPNKDEIYQTWSFWSQGDDTLWYNVDEISPQDEKVAATVVLDLPSFAEESSVKANAVVLYEIDEKILQIPIDDIKLSISDVMKGTYAMTLSSEQVNTVLAMKSISTSKFVSISVKPESGYFIKLKLFLENNSFNEVLHNVYVVKNSYFHFAVLEISIPNDLEIIIKIMAGNISQVNVIMNLLNEEFSESITILDENRPHVAAKALKEELESYFSTSNVAEWQRARVNTDLLIP